MLHRICEELRLFTNTVNPTGEFSLERIKVMFSKSNISPPGPLQSACDCGQFYYHKRANMILYTFIAFLTKPNGVTELIRPIFLLKL